MRWSVIPESRGCLTESGKWLVHWPDRKDRSIQARHSTWPRNWWCLEQMENWWECQKGDPERGSSQVITRPKTVKSKLMFFLWSASSNYYHIILRQILKLFASCEQLLHEQVGKTSWECAGRGVRPDALPVMPSCSALPSTPRGTLSHASVQLVGVPFGLICLLLPTTLHLHVFFPVFSTKLWVPWARGFFIFYLWP